MDRPVSAVDLIKLVNQSSDGFFAPNNYRTSCRSLVKRGILQQLRGKTSLRLAYVLTDIGIEYAKLISDQDGMNEKRDT